MYVEPFVHMTIQQVQTLHTSDDDYKMKLYFSEWYASRTEAELVASDIEMLRESLRTFAATKSLVKPEPKQLNPAA